MRGVARLRRAPAAGWLALVVIALAASWASSGAASRLLLALRILDDLRRPGAHSWLERTTPPPRKQAIRLEGGPGRFAADLYRPARGGSAVPLVLVPGAVELGKDDPRVAPFAGLLARSGFTVIVPDLPSMRSLRVEPDNLRELVAVHKLVCARRSLAPRGRAGLFGVSYAGGIALLVALDPARAAAVPYVATVGTFADLDTAVRFLATGRVFERSASRLVPVDPYGQLVFVRTYEEFLVNERDREGLETIIARRTADPAAGIADVLSRLSPDGRLVIDLFESHEEARVPELMARLPDALRRRIAALSPARHPFSSLRARLYLAHARDDGIFPASESERLAVLAAPHVPVHRITLVALHHAEPEPWHRDLRGFLTRDFPEAARLAGWWAAFLTERDR